MYLNTYSFRYSQTPFNMFAARLLYTQKHCHFLAAVKLSWPSDGEVYCPYVKRAMGMLQKGAFFGDPTRDTYGRSLWLCCLLPPRWSCQLTALWWTPGISYGALASWCWGEIFLSPAFWKTQLLGYPSSYTRCCTHQSQNQVESRNRRWLWSSEAGSAGFVSYLALKESKGDPVKIVSYFPPYFL